MGARIFGSILEGAFMFVSHKTLLVVFLTFSYSVAHAGAWTLEQGSGYNKVAVNVFSADDTFGTGQAGFEEFNDITVNYYAEYGVTDRLTFIGQVPLRRSRNEAVDSRTDNAGVGDIDLGFKYRLVDASWVVSAAALYKAPFLYDEDDDLPLGNGQSDLEFRLLLGKSLHPYGYIGIEAAYRFRAESPSDERRYLFEYGFDLTKNVYLRAKLDIIQAVDSTDVLIADDGNPNFPNAFDLTRAEYSAGYKFNDKTGIEFTFTDAISGDNILDGDTYQLGFVYSF